MSKVDINGIDSAIIDSIMAIEYKFALGNTYDEKMNAIRYMASIIMWVKKTYATTNYTAEHYCAALGAIVTSLNWEGVTANANNARDRPALRVEVGTVVLNIPRNSMLEIIGVLNAQEKIKITDKSALENAKTVYSFLRCFRVIASTVKRRMAKPVFFERQLGIADGNAIRVVYGGEYFNDLDVNDETIIENHYKALEAKIKNPAGKGLVERFKRIRAAVKANPAKPDPLDVKKAFGVLLAMHLKDATSLIDDNIVKNWASFKDTL